VPEGARLQQGATYIDLNEQPPQELTARGDIAAEPGNAYVPKDRVPYGIWNRLIGEEKPGSDQRINRGQDLLRAALNRDIDRR
jgi:hypothetical protein